MSESFDVIAVGTGPAGESAVSRLQAGGQRVAAVEAELIGASAPTGPASLPRRCCALSRFAPKPIGLKE